MENMTEITLETVLGYRNMLNRYAGELWEIRRNLASCQASLEEVWQAPETEGILEAVAELERQAGRMSDELSEIGFDMLKACLEFVDKMQTERSLRNG